MLKAFAQKINTSARPRRKIQKIDPIHCLYNLERLMAKVNKAYQSRHHILNRKSTKCFLITHHQQLAHLNCSLELLILVACGLKALQELLGLGT